MGSSKRSRSVCKLCVLCRNKLDEKKLEPQLITTTSSQSSTRGILTPKPEQTKFTPKSSTIILRLPLSPFTSTVSTTSTSQPSRLISTSSDVLSYQKHTNSLDVLCQSNTHSTSSYSTPPRWGTRTEGKSADHSSPVGEGLEAPEILGFAKKQHGTSFSTIDGGGVTSTPISSLTTQQKNHTHTHTTCTTAIGRINSFSLSKSYSKSAQKAEGSKEQGGRTGRRREKNRPDCTIKTHPLSICSLSVSHMDSASVSVSTLHYTHNSSDIRVGKATVRTDNPL